MKNLFLTLCASVFLFSNAIAQESKPAPVSSGDAIVCSDFVISATIFVVSVSTTVYVCCGGPFSSPGLPCSIVPKRTYELFTGAANKLPSSPQGIPVDELFPSAAEAAKNATYIDVTSSSVKAVGNRKLSIKKKRYPIDPNGNIYLEIETN